MTKRPSSVENQGQVSCCVPFAAMLQDVQVLASTRLAQADRF